jgi:hypothetical protein
MKIADYTVVLSAKNKGYISSSKKCKAHTDRSEVIPIVNTFTIDNKRYEILQSQHTGCDCAGNYYIWEMVKTEPTLWA